MAQAKAPGGGVSGFFRRLWHTLTMYWIGIKMNFIEIFTFHRKFDLKKVPRRPGEVAVITGGARGIGIEVVKKLLILDMHVIIGCRNESAGQDAVEKLRKSGIITGTTDIISLDLTSLSSVREFSNKLSLKYNKIHVLINNGGIMMTPYNITKDGNESQFQVNYLSHFLLTNLLLPKLIRAGRAGKASRIVNVSSAAQYGGKIDFDDINMKQMYSKNMAYMASKLMQVVNAKDLDARLKKEGVHVKVYAVHPGVVKTDLYEHVCLVRTFGFIFRLLYKTPEQGADGVAFAAISSKFEGEGGLFFANSKKYSVNSLAKKANVQKQLWDLSCQLTGWEDVPISEMVRQAMASRHDKYTVSSKVQNSADVEKNPASGSKSIIATKLDPQTAQTLSNSNTDSDTTLEDQEQKMQNTQSQNRLSISSESSSDTLLGNDTNSTIVGTKSPPPEIIVTSFETSESFVIRGSADYSYSPPMLRTEPGSISVAPSSATSTATSTASETTMVSSSTEDSDSTIVSVAVAVDVGTTNDISVSS